MLAFRLLKLRVALLVAVLFAALTVNRISYGKSFAPVSDAELLNVHPPAIVVSTNFVGTARNVFRKVNFQREREGLKSLAWEEDLSDVALEYSKQMASEEFFSHFDSNGHSVVDRVVEYGIKDWLKLGENLYMSEGFIEPVDLAVDGWMESTSHRDNILDVEWTHTGVGVFSTKGRKTFITQVFMKKSKRRSSIR